MESECSWVCLVKEEKGKISNPNPNPKCHASKVTNSGRDRWRKGEKVLKDATLRRSTSSVSVADRNVPTPGEPENCTHSFVCTLF